jgi:hypothetical protein
MAVNTKVVPKFEFFYLEYDKPLAQLAADAGALARPMAVTLVRGGAAVDGDLQIIAQGEGNIMQLGFPARGLARAGGKYKTRVTAPFKCAYMVHEGSGAELVEAWAEFLGAVEDAGLQMTDERRVLLQVNRGGDAGTVRSELQVGIE